MKKVFLITALVALGALSLAGCGMQSDKTQTQEETSERARIAAEQTDETADNGETPSTENDGKECPDGCPDKKRRDKRGHGRENRSESDLPGRLALRGHDFIFQPSIEEFMFGMRTATRTQEADKPEIEESENSESGVKRDRLTPRPRMPKKNGDFLPEPPVSMLRQNGENSSRHAPSRMPFHEITDEN